MEVILHTKWFIAVAMLGVLVAELVMVLDLLVTGLLERYHGFWPITEYYCVCGFSVNVNRFWPSNVYRILKAIKHDRCCLSKLLYFAGRNITPKWQNFACEEMVKRGKELTNMDWNTYENLSRSDLGLPRKPLTFDDL